MCTSCGFVLKISEEAMINILCCIYNTYVQLEVENRTLLINTLLINTLSTLVQRVLPFIGANIAVATICAIEAWTIVTTRIIVLL